VLGGSAPMLADLAFQNVLEQASRMRAWFALAVALSMAACNDEPIEDVPQDVCVSGHRWIGGRRGSEEMYPGRDCVGCHLENDGPQLMAGGTVYGFGQGREGQAVVPTLGQPQSVDCFGLEGVKVTLTAADGTLFETVTNRAGNFFFEGRPEQLAKPFKANIQYDVPASDDKPANKADIDMGTSPSYGGCARCHNPYSTPTEMFNPEPPPEAVIAVAVDYIDLRLPVTDFIDDDSTASAGVADDAAHQRSVAEIEGFVNGTAGH
jgi:hypothetical protein